MRVLETAVYRGPHLYSRTPMIRIQLDLDDETDAGPGLVSRLLELFPGLQRHHCSTGHEGGFVERLHDGTRLGHVIEHVALELQVEAGLPAGRGKTRAVRGHEGIYNVMFAYQDEQVGRLAGRIATALVGGAGVQGLDLIAPPPSPDAGAAIPGLAALRAHLGPPAAVTGWTPGWVV